MGVKFGLLLREEHELRVCEAVVVRKICGSKRGLEGTI